ncbi:hypothetical protein MP638_007443 [Amoeboaphelidium occidentale]|nr:hypothetical protein MP638_007443 [Amoeboaphelidium occidentale]
MILELQDLPVEILRHIALNLEWFNLSFLIQALPNGSEVFDAVFKSKFYSENYSDNAVWAANIAGEEDENLYKLLLADEKNLSNWVKSQALCMELDLDDVRFGLDYDPSMCIPVDEARDICYAPIGIAVDLVNEFIPCAALLVYQFHHTHTFPEYKRFLFDLDKVMTQNAARMGLYWPIGARVFVELMVLNCRDEKTAAPNLVALYCTMSDLDFLQLSHYEEAFPSFYERLFEENVYDLCLNDICEAITQNCPGHAQDTLAKMELLLSTLKQTRLLEQWLNDRFKTIDKIKWIQALLDIEDWNLDNARTNSRTQAVIDLFTDNEIPLWPLFDDFISPHNNSDKSIGILVALLKAVIFNGEKTKVEVEELLLEFMRKNSEYETVIKRVRRRLSEPAQDDMEHDDL